MFFYMGGVIILPYLFFSFISCIGDGSVRELAEHCSRGKILDVLWVGGIGILKMVKTGVILFRMDSFSWIVLALSYVVSKTPKHWHINPWLRPRKVSPEMQIGSQRP
jgi:hypothetical protein